jgi:hypothetical protein
MKVWITKYALTAGITEIDAEVCSSVSDGMIRVPKKEGSHTYDDYYHKPYWHETREEAVKRAESMRVKKIASLKNSLAKFEKMKFQ